ncbi:YqiA/YcfP family alpha/beta fold hydrolase [Myxococcus sp. AS-1-15]|uniref:YqiA/YcfP family alpha/beta fold hydrolase n=1 Tax=Myxococcus sp. AS-1-15 TaxID=2874600 RepID=UPI001CBC7843|nr:YqiA/YcfP family alpha/beta fold hydrolase [Myxococcus sp. AS-1-15]MBZ4398573.1 alpha/beta fold hydrolase [Myxococcus sp. AS-1-15]
MSDLPPAPAPLAPRFMYLHGFASGPNSTKGLALSRHFEPLGVHIERLNLRVPSFEELKLSAITDTVRAALGGKQDRVVLLGSSLGGLTAARVAAEDARVCGLVLMAPAFHIVTQLRKRMGEALWEHWRTTGWIPTEDFVEKRTSKVHWGFVEDALALDERLGNWPDVRVPTLLIHGRADDTCDIANSRRWAQGRRNVKLVEVDDGHELTASLPFILEQTEAFLRPWGGSA